AQTLQPAFGGQPRVIVDRPAEESVGEPRRAAQEAVEPIPLRDRHPDNRRAVRPPRLAIIAEPFGELALQPLANRARPRRGDPKRPGVLELAGTSREAEGGEWRG